MKKNLLSIIVPIFNVEDYLPRCIDSLICQDYNNIEIILVDDGSTDKSGKIADEYQKKDDRIIVIHKKNGGLSDARNAGIDKASGDFLCFVDSDDYVEKNIYDLSIKKMIQDSIDILVFEISKEYSNGRNKEFKIKKETVLNRESALIELNTFNNIDFSACNKVFRKELFDNVRFPINKKCEDIYTMYKVFYKANQVYLLPRVGYHYCYRDGSISHSKSINLDYVYAFKAQIEYFEKLSNEKLIKIAKSSYSYSCLNIVNLILKNKIDDTNLLNKMRKESHKYSKFVYSNKYLKKSKKIQYIVFDKIFILYQIIILIKNRI